MSFLQRESAYNQFVSSSEAGIQQGFIGFVWTPVPAFAGRDPAKATGVTILLYLEIQVVTHNTIYIILEIQREIRFEIFYSGQ
jgi:hypothetical protein